MSHAAKHCSNCRKILNQKERSTHVFFCQVDSSAQTWTDLEPLAPKIEELMNLLFPLPINEEVQARLAVVLMDLPVEALDFHIGWLQMATQDIEGLVSPVDE